MRDERSQERLRAHYLIEKELARQINSSSRAERQHLYSEAYDRLFREVPDHPQLTRKNDPVIRQRDADAQLRLLGPFLEPEMVFLEIGAGDCAVSAEVARRVRKVIAVDVSRHIAVGAGMPGNLELVISDGTTIPGEADTVDLVYSNQLMEHLHVDDALIQLKNIYRVIRPGGFYICLTPNRVSGPHDISKYFDREATGFHLREYTAGELRSLFREAGFNRVRSLIGARGHYVEVPTPVAVILETVVGWVPQRLRKALPGWPIVQALLGIQMRAIKSR